MQLKKRWNISENREFKNSAEAMIKNIGNFEKMCEHLLKEFQYEIDNVLNINRFEKVNEITKPKLTIRHSEDFIKVYIDIKPIVYTRNTINILEMDLMDYSIRINDDLDEQANLAWSRYKSSLEEVDDINSDISILKDYKNEMEDEIKLLEQGIKDLPISKFYNKRVINKLRRNIDTIDKELQSKYTDLDIFRRNYNEYYYKWLLLSRQTLVNIIKPYLRTLYGIFNEEYNIIIDGDV